MTEDMVGYFNQKTGMNLTPIFDQYLRHTEIPKLELRFDNNKGTVSYRWKADEPAFQMPVRVGKKGNWQTIKAKADWQTMPTLLTKEEFEVATELYYVNVSKE
jgi:aminopeptidase N